MNLLLNLFTYGVPGLLYTLSLITIHRKFQEGQNALKFFTFIFAFVHIAALFTPIYAMMLVVLGTQTLISLLLIRSFTKDALIIRGYFLISIILLVNQL